MSILVRHAMTPSPQTIGPEMNAADAASMMQSEDVGLLPVVGEGSLMGIVTDRDLVLRVLAQRRDPMQVRVGDILTREVVSVSPDEKLSSARDLMAEHRIRRLPVLKRGELVGVLSLGDVAWQDASRRKVGETLRAVSESESTAEPNAAAPAMGNPNVAT
ncbi:MAG TPA: CBS domain-containing protein [Actinomycetota bacterium]|jgi:CBS domain-containing protein